MDGENAMNRAARKRRLFETDGIRGKANAYPMTPEIALRVGKAVAKYFIERNGKTSHRIVIGKDTRRSGYMLENALVSGIVSMGANALLVGPIPTPAIAHLAKSLNCDAGIMLSASHNPAEDNGIKIFSGEGFKLDDKVELEIERLIFSDIDASHITGNLVGGAKRIDDAAGRYIEFVKNSINNQPLDGLKIVLDVANGSAYRIATWVFSELGAEVIVMNDSPDGMNINADCGALHIQGLAGKVRETGADIGIAFDGDADRIAVCDETGKEVDGNALLAIFALDLSAKGKLKNNCVVSTVMANSALTELLGRHGIRTVHTPVGDRYVIGEMRRGTSNFGGEPNGHTVFFDYNTTDDAMVAALQLLAIMKRSGKKVSELASVLRPFPQALVNVKVREKKPFENLPRVKQKIAEAEKSLAGNGKVLVRYSGTEMLASVLVESGSTEKSESLAAGIAEAIKKEIGA